jgi:alkaline phosphatase D
MPLSCGGATLGALMDARAPMDARGQARAPKALLPRPESPMPDRRQALKTAATAAAVMAAVPFVRHVRAADVPRFALGVASGSPRADRVVLWTRVTVPAGLDDLPERVPVRWELARDEGFRRIEARGVEEAEAAWAHSVHAEPAGLEPGRWYWYRFHALGQTSAIGRTRTAPGPDVPATLDFAIASCQRYEVNHYAAWRHLAADGLDLVLFLGDYLYEYGANPSNVRRLGLQPLRSLEDFRARHALYRSDPALQAAHAACPWILVWDDHEVDNDYAGLQGQDLDPGFPLRRAMAYQAYWEHLPFPKAARPVGPSMRIFERFAWGRLATIHALDDRQYRDPQACPRPGRGGSNTLPERDCPALRDPARSLLGAEQEAWLAAGWDLERPWNLLAQQTLMTRLTWRDPADPGGPVVWTDGWDGYPIARQRLLDVVRERRVPGVVVLGGDMHAHYVADLRADPQDPRSVPLASEFCGTSISSHGWPQARLDAIRDFNPDLKFARSDRRGAVRFHLDHRRLQASLLGVDDATRADSAVSVLARFVVEAGRPGPQAA